MPTPIYTFLTLLPFHVCLFWTAVLALEWRQANPAKHLLALFMAVCTALYLCHALYFNGCATAVSNGVYVFCNLAVFPLYLIYICRLTGSRPSPGRCAALLAPSAIVCITVCLSTVCSLPLQFHSIKMIVPKAIFLCQLVPICCYGTRRLRHFDRRLEDYFSDTETRSVKHTRWMMTALCICSCVSAVVSLLGREHFLGETSLLALPSLFFASLLFVVGYVGEKQEFSADDLMAQAEDVAPTEPAEEDEGTDAGAAHRLRVIDALMQAERLYLMPDLRLSDVAARLGMGRTTLSAAINQSGQSFSDYVNALRVRHAQQIMQDSVQSAALSVIQIAEQSGFTSESSFYRAFRKATGMTPRQWLHRQGPDAATRQSVAEESKETARVETCR